MSKSPSLRRIQADIRELAFDPSDRYHAAPLESDMFEWHFTIRGAVGTDFEGGVYHGRIMLPPEYPFKPPHIIFLTPSGRFETNTKVCLSFSAYHPELWQPAWGIRLILEALISFLPTPADGAIGALDWTSAERKRLAQKSVNYHCPTCGCKTIELLPTLKPKKEGENKSRFQKEIEKLQQLQILEHAQKVDDESKKEKQKKDGKEEAISEGETETGKKLEPAAREHTLAKEQITDDMSENEAASTECDVHVLQPVTEQNINRSESLSEELTATNGNAKNTCPEEKKKNEVDLPNSTSDSAAPVPRVEEPNVRRLQIQQQQHQVDAPADNGVLSGIVDPVLHGIIVTLAILCFLFLRKLQAMIEELNELNRVLDG